jgi:hypothetical protein
MNEPDALTGDAHVRDDPSSDEGIVLKTKRKEYWSNHLR